MGKVNKFREVLVICPICVYGTFLVAWGANMRLWCIKKTSAINAYWGTRPIIPQKSINYACKGPWETHNPHQALMAVQTLASFFPEIAQMSKKSKWLTKVTGFFLVLSFFWLVLVREKRWHFFLLVIINLWWGSLDVAVFGIFFWHDAFLFLLISKHGISHTFHLIFFFALPIILLRCAGGCDVTGGTGEAEKTAGIPSSGTSEFGGAVGPWGTHG